MLTCIAAARISSFEKNPENGGIPEIARTPISIVTKVSGIFFQSPPILVMSVSSWSACITAPAQRKSIALKKACVMRWNIEAENAPIPTASIM